MTDYDLIIRNARVADGTGAPCYRADVALSAGRIAALGRLAEDASAHASIDAAERVLAPGFIDIHNHSDFLVLRDPAMHTKLKQGVTTQVIGQCGISAAPVTPENLELLDRYVGFIKAGAEPDWSWRSFGDWLGVLDSLALGTNVASMVGHGTVRIAVMGFADRRPTDGELQRLRQMIRDAMSAGAFGMTTGLIYPPGVYAATQEIVDIAAALRDFAGLYASHIRNESYRVLESVREAIDVAERNRIAGQISHFKAAGRKNWGKVKQTLELLEQARDRGVDIAADVYPYTAASTTLRAMLPPWVNEGGLESTLERLRDTAQRTCIVREIETTEDWENFYLQSGGAEGVIPVYTPATPDYEGRTLAEIANRMGKPALDAALDLIVMNKGWDNTCYRMMSEDDVRMVLQHPLTMVASDSIPSGPGAKGHPRTNGTFPRVLGEYVREQGILSLEDAVRKMSSMPAGRLGLAGKGLIQAGMDADLVVFDPQTVNAGADFDHPDGEPVGIDYVFVNGRKAIDHGEPTGAAAGRVLRKG